MSNTELRRRIIEIIDEVLGTTTDQFHDKMQARDFLGWDSLNSVRIMVAIENACNVRFTLQEMERLQCLGDLFALVEAKAGPK